MSPICPTYGIHHRQIDPPTPLMQYFTRRSTAVFTCKYVNQRSGTNRFRGHRCIVRSIPMHPVDLVLQAAASSMKCTMYTTCKKSQLDRQACMHHLHICRAQARPMDHARLWLLDQYAFSRTIINWCRSSIIQLPDHDSRMNIGLYVEYCMWMPSQL